MPLNLVLRFLIKSLLFTKLLVMSNTDYFVDPIPILEYLKWLT